MVGYKSFTTIQKWETGDSEPNMGVLRQLADIFHLSISELVETDLENKSSDRPLPSNIILPSAHKLPIMGTICAGDGVVCEDFVQDQIYAIERLDYNEASLKRVTQDGDTLILNPCNPEYHAMVTDYEDVRIIGRCVGVLHKYV